MKDFDQQICDVIAAEPITVPDYVHLRTEQLLESLPEKVPVHRIHLWPRMTALAASLLFVLLVMLPNVSVTYAQTMEQIPVIGELVQMFTIRSYQIDQNNHSLDVPVMAINDPRNPDASSLINKDVDELTSAVIRQFYDELEISQGQGVGAINIDYETLTNTSDWFTMKLLVEEIRGSTNSYARYYHIDRTTGKYVHFGDLFDKADFPALEEMILNQMEQQMAADSNVSYFEQNDIPSGEESLQETTLPGHAFVKLDEDQGFYFRENGDLVIVYDRYEVAPGFMGCPEFVLPLADIQTYMKPLHG